MAKPLHYACLGKSYNCAKFLLDNGAFINSQDKVIIKFTNKKNNKFGNTPLHISILNNDLQLCELLENYKPNLNLKNKVKECFYYGVTHF